MAPFVGMMSFDFVILSLWIRAERLGGEDRLNLKKLYCTNMMTGFLAIFCLRAGVAVTQGGSISQSNYRAQPCMFDDGIRAFRDGHLVVMLQSLNIYSLVRFNRGIQSFY
jgi:hypothetical protein